MALAQLEDDQLNPEVIFNENFSAIAGAEVYGKNAATTSGLNYGYYGGQYGAFAIVDGTVALSNGATNYVVVLRSTGAVSASTSTTNWNNTALYARVGIGVCAGGVMTSWTPYRFGLYGTHGPYGILADVANVFTKTQSVTPVINAAATGSVTPDATASNNFRYTITGNLTINNPTGLVDGTVYNFRLKENGTGGYTIAFGSKFKWAGGTVPTWVTTANAVNFFSAYYDGGDDILICSGAGGYA